MLHHVGIAASFTIERRQELVEELAPLRESAPRRPPVARLGGSQDAEAAPDRRMPGATSRWNRGKDLSWEPLRIERVCEVGYDHLQGDRFRHATHFVRWRPDKPPADCRYDQLEERPPRSSRSCSAAARRPRVHYETVDARALSLLPAASISRRVTCRLATTTRSSSATRLGLAMTSSPGTSDSTSTASSSAWHAVSRDASASRQFPWNDVVEHLDHREPDRAFAFAFALREASHCACIAINTPATRLRQRRSSGIDSPTAAMSTIRKFESASS